MLEVRVAVDIAAVVAVGPAVMVIGEAVLEAPATLVAAGRVGLQAAREVAVVALVVDRIVVAEDQTVRRQTDHTWTVAVAAVAVRVQRNSSRRHIHQHISTADSDSQWSHGCMVVFDLGRQAPASRLMLHLPPEAQEIAATKPFEPAVADLWLPGTSEHRPIASKLPPPMRD